MLTVSTTFRASLAALALLIPLALVGARVAGRRGAG